MLCIVIRVLLAKGEAPTQQSAAVPWRLTSLALRHWPPA
jgi:hypothetical protein